jgi:hypothetical protein
MSNKLTSKKLDLLIEQVLMEKINFDGDGVKIATNDDRKKFALPSPHGQRPSIQALKALAGLEPKNDHISKEDFVDAFKLPDDDKRNITAKTIATDAADRDVRDAVEKIYNDSTKAKQDQLDLDIGTEMPNKIAKQDKEKAIPDVDLDYYSRVSKSSDNYKKFEPKGYLSTSTADVFEGFFERNSANTVEKRLKAVADFSNNIFKLSQGDDADAKTALTKHGAQGIMNDAIVAKVLAKLSREIQGASAGTLFETYLAILLSGVVTGGSGAAADAGIVGKPIYLSMKFEAKAFSGEQSSGNLQKELQEAGTIWYIGGKKVGGKKTKIQTGTSFGHPWTKETTTADPKKAPKEGGTETVEIFITGVQLSENKLTTKEGEPQNFQFVDLSGTVFKETKGVAVTTGVKLGIEYKSDADFVINIADPTTLAQGAESFDKMFVKAVEKLDDVVKNAVKKISEVYQSSDKITEKMKSYVAKDNIDAGNEVRKTYISMLTTLNSVFDEIKGTDSSGDKQVKQIGGTLSENKNKSLKDLDKLIEHVILNKMNK